MENLKHSQVNKNHALFQMFFLLNNVEGIAEFLEHNWLWKKIGCYRLLEATPLIKEKLMCAWLMSRVAFLSIEEI